MIELTQLETKIVGVWNFHKTLLWEFAPTNDNYEGQLTIYVPDIASKDPSHSYKLAVEDGVNYLIIDGNRKKIESLTETELSYSSDKGVLTLHKGWQ